MLEGTATRIIRCSSYSVSARRGLSCQASVLVNAGPPKSCSRQAACHRRYRASHQRNAKFIRFFGSLGRNKDTYPVLGVGTKPSESLEDFAKRYSNIDDGSRLVDSPDVVLCGRLVSKPREASKKLFFYHIRSGGRTIQIIGDQRYYDETVANGFQESHRSLNQGDIVSIRGFPGKTKRGELSLVSREMCLLAPCLATIPSGRGDGKYALSDKGVRYRNRHMDLLANGDSVLSPFLIRARAISFLRRFLEKEGFLEVETPIISGSAGGALAQPFKTQAQVTGNAELSLRIAPELFLKQLVIGGCDRVFELGKVFRNEGVSPNHNPEFTSCEFYAAYMDYDDLMVFTERLLSDMATAVTGSTILPGGIDMQPPFRRISVIQELEKAHGLPSGTFPDVNDMSNVERVGMDLKVLLATRLGPSESKVHLSLQSSAPATPASNCKLVDELIGLDIEPQCEMPTFICDHPVAMSPLAKAHPSDGPRAGLSQRFELFVKGKEVVNAYSELNDPSEQLVRFQNQLQGRSNATAESGQDIDVMPIDERFCKALEFGLPPTAGWGMGVDRIAMLLSGATSIRDVIFFPLMSASDSSAATTSSTAAPRPEVQEAGAASS